MTPWRIAFQACARTALPLLLPALTSAQALKLRNVRFPREL
jgi:hypothetical protein